MILGDVQVGTVLLVQTPGFWKVLDVVREVHPSYVVSKYARFDRVTGDEIKLGSSRMTARNAVIATPADIEFIETEHAKSKGLRDIGRLVAKPVNLAHLSLEEIRTALQILSRPNRSLLESYAPNGRND